MEKKRGHDDNNIPIDRLIQKQREELQQQSGLLPGLYEQAECMRTRQASFTTRATMRLHRDIDRIVNRIEARIRHIETGEHLHEFDRSVVPFVEAYNRQSGVPKRKLTRMMIPGESRTRFETIENTQSQAMVVYEFLAKVNGDVPRARIERSDMCPRCIDQCMVLVPNKAIVACPTCGISSTYLDATSQSISYDDSLEMVQFSYKRGNHFQDWLVNAQGQEAHEVAQEIVDLVMQELYKQRITSLDDITTKKVREVLKLHKLRRCYEHCPQIVSRITGRKAPCLPPEAAELCRLMFTAVQVPFARHCPPDRKNMLSYSFVLSKMLYILGYDDLCDTLTMLKGRDKLLKMDSMWKKITEELDWEYFASV